MGAQLLGLFDVPPEVVPQAPAPDEVCPFPAVNSLGEKLVHWGRTGAGQLIASYAVPVAKHPKCWLCGAVMGDQVGVSINPVSGRMAFGCETCVTKAGTNPGDAKLTSMATATHTGNLPDCRNCGRPYHAGHNHHLGVGSFCDIDGEPFYAFRYRPAEPFRERGYPHRIVQDIDQKTGGPIYADEAEEAAA